jgi:hypothetical protein
MPLTGLDDSVFNNLWLGNYKNELVADSERQIAPMWRAWRVIEAVSIRRLSRLVDLSLGKYKVYTAINCFPISFLGVR